MSLDQGAADRPEIARVVGAVKRYAGVLALDAVDFSIRAGEVRALLGKNGAGKSTLIRLLTGAETPDEGTVAISGRELTERGNMRTRATGALGVRPVYQELSLVPDMSIAENIFLGRWPRRLGVLDHRQMEERAREALHNLGIDLNPSHTIAMLSPAERQLVEITRATMGEPRLVILDEPTSSLAAAEVELVFGAVRRMQEKGAAVIYVSHRMKEIREIADSATIMRDGKAISTVDIGSVDTREIVRMMLGSDEKHGTTIARRVLGDVVLSVRDVVAPPRLSGVTFDLRKGEVLGVAGLLGAGRTELLRIIAGLDRQQSGHVVIHGRNVDGLNWHDRIGLGLGFTPESRKDDGIVPLLGIDENTVITNPAGVSRHGVLSSRLVARATRGIIESMSVKATDTTTPIATLSGGNQQKIVIGRWVYANSGILLLDEPTRGVDVEAKNQIYAIIRRLAEEGKSILFISSEVEELPQVCDTVVILKDGGIGGKYTAPDLDADELLTACMASAH
ncbi:MAG: sugar ABC transporter ATP-binding protein [Rhizobiaceae bacterium]|nr:sugar ABC transporter ATP-binding protein [Rhizobiaceae bacterium]